MDNKTREQLAKDVKPRLTDDFLDTLEQALEICDCNEVAFFIEDIFRLAGKEPPNL